MKQFTEEEIEMWCDADRVSRMTEEEKSHAPTIQEVFDSYHDMMMNKWFERKYLKWVQILKEVDNLKEEWRGIEFFNKKYEVSNCGNIRSYGLEK